MNQHCKTLRIDADQLQPYADAGVTLIPLRAWNSHDDKGNPTGKLPLKGWRTNPYNTAKVIAGSIKANRNTGWRIGNGWIALDFDPRNAFGDDELSLLLAKFGIDPATLPTMDSGGAGVHVYFRVPKGLKFRNTVPGFSAVEVKGVGRFVVAAGSIHPNGRFYRWREGRPPLCEAPLAPKALLNAIKRPELAPDFAPDSARIEPEQLASMLAALPVEDFGSNDAWEPILMAAHHATGGAGLPEFVEWSTQDPAYSDHAAMIEARWNSLDSDKAGGRTIGTLNKALADAGHPELVARISAAEDFDGEPDEIDEFDFEGEADDEETFDFEGSSTALVPVEDRGLVINDRTQVAPDTIANAYAAVVGSGLVPAWDELKQNTVFRTKHLPWDETYGRIVNDHVLRLVRLYFVNQWQGNSYQPGLDNLMNAIVTIAYAQKFNPVLEYVDSITWDGVKRVEKLFGYYFNCGDDAYTRAVSLCFMIGAVRRMRRPGCKFDTMPILKGPQGWDKSTGVKILFGEEFWSDANLGSLRDKDAALKLRGIWVQEFAEVDSLTRSEANVLKHFCGLQYDRQRDPYGRITENSPRRCVFIATVNEGGYLKDPTGARRFWPLEIVQRVSVTDIRRDRDQLWAEAAALEAQGMSDVLPKHLWDEAGERAAEQTTDDPWADAIRLFLEGRADAYKNWKPNEEGEPRVPPDRVHTSELYAAMAIKTENQTKDKAQRLRTVMEATLGWQHHRGVRVLGRTGAGYVRQHTASGESKYRRNAVDDC